MASQRTWRFNAEDRNERAVMMTDQHVESIIQAMAERIAEQGQASSIELERQMYKQIGRLEAELAEARRQIAQKDFIVRQLEDQVRHLGEALTKMSSGGFNPAAVLPASFYQPASFNGGSESA